jgi:23S rRNA (uracil1939-C5)-methyltransferase
MNQTPKLKKGQTLPITIETLVFGGQGLGKAENGQKVFVDGTVPGDTVEVRVNKVKSGYAEAKRLTILKASPLRVEPKCRHFDTCGGCKWQFLSYEDQLKFKEQQVKDSIERLAELPGDLVLPILPNESPWNYRNKMDLSFGTGPDGKVMLGFYPPGFHFEVFNLTECHLMNDWMGSFVSEFRDFVNSRWWKVFNTESGEGLLRNLMIREGKNTGDVMVSLITSHEHFPKGTDDLSALIDWMKARGNISSLYLSKITQKKGQATKQKEVLLFGKKTLTESLKLENGDELFFDILPQAFFQTNTRQAEKLYTRVLELAGLTGKEIVMDLYCGTGTIGLFCAHKAKRVIGVELNASAVDNARANAARNSISNAEFFLGDTERVLENHTENGDFPKPDVIIVDPPRNGLGPNVVHQCADFGARTIIYVSCNPTTLARDLKSFAKLGYTCELVHPVDMFPQTYHVECIAKLTRS